MNKTDARLSVIGAIIAATILVLDFQTPLGVAAGVPYVGLVLVGWWFTSEKSILLLAVLGTALTIVGYAASPEGGIPWVVAFNRIVAMCAIWITAVILLVAKRATQKNLAVTEQKYTSLVDNAPIGIVEVTPDGKFTFVNPAFAEMLGYDSPQELIESVTDIQNQMYVNPELRPDVIDGLMMDRRSYNEYELYRKDGSAVWISENADVVLDDRGRIVRHESIVTDITEQKKQAEQLKEISDFLANASEMAAIGFWILEHQSFTYVHWSEGMNKIFEFNPSPLGTKPVRNVQEGVADIILAHPDDLEWVCRNFCEFVRKGGSYDIEYRVVLANGETRWLREVATAIDFKDGKYMRSYGATQDITERKKAEAKIEETNTFLSQASQLAKFGFWVWDHENFTYDLWSEGLVDIYEFDPNKRGATHRSVFSLDNTTSVRPGDASTLDEMNWIHPEDRDRAAEAFRQLVTNGTMLDQEYRIVLPSGKTKWIHDMGVATELRDGKYLRSYGTTQDVTDRKNVEIALGESIQFNETIFANSPIGISIFDDTGRCVSTNDAICDIVGGAREEIMAQNFYTIPSWRESGLYDVAKECLATRERKVHEMRTISSFGKGLDIECHLASIDVNGSQHLLLMIADVSEQKAMQAQLIQQSKMATLGEMATGVAHELNQPLSVIRMAVNNIQRRVKKQSVDPAYFADKMGKIERQVERASEVIEHMRVFGHRADLNPAVLDPKHIVDSTLLLMGEQLKLAGIDVSVIAPETCHAIMGHQVQVEQVLLNLLGNARDQLDGADGDKRIDITISQDLNHVKIAVSDSGGGIPEDIVPRIFEPFYSTKEMGVGTGLGLSISYGIITEMGGTLSAGNTDDGACFAISLPAFNGDNRASA